ncbi:MAG: hypothetical protein J5842_02540 [Lachnospiraceae bacterium]|nr:hypothetical protein [Lachnospiraceae bacterium]
MKKENKVIQFILCMIDGMLFMTVLLFVNDLVQILLDSVNYKKKLKEKLRSEKAYYYGEEDDEE